MMLISLIDLFPYVTKVYFRFKCLGGIEENQPVSTSVDVQLLQKTLQRKKKSTRTPISLCSEPRAMAFTTFISILESTPALTANVSCPLAQN